MEIGKFVQEHDLFYPPDPGDLKDDLSENVWNEKLKAVMKDMYEKAKELNGQVSGEHGIGFAKKEYLSEENISIMRGIKEVFDPKNILNPGKVYY